MNNANVHSSPTGFKRLLLATAVSLACQNVIAQELEKITVTAQYKEEDLQSVPIAITALGEQDIELRNMTNALDINETVPNINIAKNTGAATGMKVFLRGIGEDESRAGADPAIGIYVDGVYIGRQTGALLDLADIQSIEVLRGPQGTLYGRNSNGGALRITTRQPSLDDEVKLKLSAGNYDLASGYLMVNKALSDKLAAQVSLFTQNRDGFMTNKDNGDKLGKVDKEGAKLGVKYVGDVWDLLLSADFSADNSEPGYPARVLDDDGDIFTTTQAEFPLTPLAGGDTELGDFFNSTYQRGVSFSAHRAFGDMEFDSLTSYRSLDNQLFSIISLPYYQDLAQSQRTQEFRLSEANDTGEWVAGLYLYNEKIDQYSEFVSGYSRIFIDTNSAALFGQYTYHATEQLHLTGGLRYTWEEKDFTGIASPDYWSALGRGNAGDQSNDWSNLSWKAVVAYDVSDDLMTYASVTTGFKSGGWSVDSFLAVEDETVVTYEVGMKSDLTKALRININGFFNDYTDLQVNGSTAVGFTRINAGDVETYGIEANLTYQITDDLVIDAYVGTLDGEYKSLTAEAQALIADDYDLKQAPPLTYGFNLSYFKEAGNGNIIANLQYAYTDKQYNDLGNAELIARDETNIVNARLGYKWGGEIEYSIAAWAKNLLDEEYAAAGTAGNSAIYPGDPRTVGVDFSVTF